MQTKPKNYELSESRIISENELKKLTKAIRPFMELATQNRTNLHYINDYFLIVIGSLTGLRVSEIAGIKIGMVHPNSLEIVGKGNKKRIVPLGAKGKEYISKFMELKREVFGQKIEPNQYLFLSKRGLRFTRQGINKRLKKWCKISGIREFSFHAIRHYYATYCLNQGFNLSEVQKFLGHSSVTTTSIYLHFTAQTQIKVDALL